MPRRTIAHILPWANVAGTEVATIRLAEAARAAGYDNLIYVPDVPEAPAFAAYAAARRLATVRYQPVVPERRRPWAFATNVLRLAFDFRRRGVGLVHCAEVDGAFFAALAGRLAGARVVCHVRCESPALTPLELWLLKPVQHYVFVSRDTLARAPFPFAADAAEVLYDGIDPPHMTSDADAARAHYGLPAGAFVLGMAARFSAQKDHSTLLRALDLVCRRRDDVHLLLAGANDREPERSIYRALEPLVAAETRRHVHACGFEADMGRFYAAIDAKVLATHFEGLPLVIIEAMAAGRPVIATAVSGIPEVVADGVTGLLVPPRRPDLLAEAILALADDRTRAGRLGAAGRERVATLFSATRYARAVADFYGRMLGAPRGRVTPPSIP